MAEFIMGEPQVDEIRVCPYQSNHKIKLKSMEAHLEKCRDRSRPNRYQKCPYNPNHVKFVEEMPLHLEICPDLTHFGQIKSIDSFINRNENSLAINQVETRDFMAAENWDDDVPVTYDPIFKATRFQPKNMHKRREKIYHPDANLVINDSDAPIIHNPLASQVENAFLVPNIEIKEERQALEEQLQQDEQARMMVQQWLENVPDGLERPPSNDFPIQSECVDSSTSLDDSSLLDSFDQSGPNSSFGDGFGNTGGRDAPVAERNNYMQVVGDFDEGDLEFAAMNGITVIPSRPKKVVQFKKPAMVSNSSTNRDYDLPHAGQGLETRPSVKRARSEDEPADYDREFAALNGVPGYAPPGYSAWE